MCAEGIPVRIHGFLDGRDSPPKAAIGHIQTFEADIADLDDCRIATVSGRYYALDRDNRWERVQQSYACMTDAKGLAVQNAEAAVNAAYADGLTDEFVLPVPISGYEGMQDGDGVLMSNFRADVREIMQHFAHRTLTVPATRKLSSQHKWDGSIFSAHAPTDSNFPANEALEYSGSGRF